MDFNADACAGAGNSSFDEMFPTLVYLRKYRPRTIAQFEEVLDKCRRFRKLHIDPNALRLDRMIMNDSRYVAEDLIRATASERLFTTMIPAIFGGGGYSFGAFMIGMEELAAGCLGIANLMGVHGLALSTVAATGDLGHMEDICRELATTEKAGKPHLLSTAITEPSAGTDVEDIELLRKARLVCEAKPVKGGYRLNGRKVFISNGSIAQTHIVIMVTDRNKPDQTMWCFRVDNGTPGFSIGRVERKMGQKACPAAELVFEDCFIPEMNRIGSHPVAGRGVDMVLGATRGAVGVFGTGVARGAYERALAYAQTHKVRGKWLIDQQWVQFRLTDMYRNVMMGRASYIEAMLSNELFGLSSLISAAPAAQEMSKHLPSRLFDNPVMKAVLHNPRTRSAVWDRISGIPEWKSSSACAFGEAAKVLGTDVGMANCSMAVDIMGADGLRHDRGMEKLFRDSKLLQIYEGTNQLNRIEIYKHAVNRAA